MTTEMKRVPESQSAASSRNIRRRPLEAGRRPVGVAMVGALLVLLATGVLGVGEIAAQPRNADPRCPVANAAGTAGGEEVKPPIALQAEPQSAAKVINFGADRNPESVLFHVTVPPPGLPAGLEDHLELVADEIVRSGETTDSVSFPDPRFSALKLSGNRKRITFRACLDPPEDLPAGKYVGIVSLEGPQGVDSAAVTITGNAKNGTGFYWAAILTGILAFLVLFYKGMSDEHAARVVAVATLPDKDEDGTPNAEKAAAARWWPAAKALLNPGWLAPTLVAIGATVGVLVAAYTSNPAWGENGLVSSAIALIGTGLAAVGAKAIFTSSTK